MVPKRTLQITRVSASRSATSLLKWSRRALNARLFNSCAAGDEHGDFEIVAPPTDAASAAEIRKEADRITRNVMPAAKGKSRLLALHSSNKSQGLNQA